MENAPDIILFWNLFIIIFVLMIIFIIMAIILLKKNNEHNPDKTHLLGKICLILCTICAVPIILLVGYILYLCTG